MPVKKIDAMGEDDDEYPFEYMVCAYKDGKVIIDTTTGMVHWLVHKGYILDLITTAVEGG
ncbi:hypothetical protein M8C21_015541 [Ambrosia artemisiifolia]|uniref:Uncharacterized protein n=1 Tax=Ambrosia artemisiifolia TaxID=4212 RepID=A0AAD5GUN6_AMBAR|nr:hypothetical protein M8C21_015541 [Ambrosia artemisiifolia]